MAAPAHIGANPIPAPGAHSGPDRPVRHGAASPSSCRSTSRTPPLSPPSWLPWTRRRQPSRLWLCHEDWRWLADRRAAAGEARLVQSTRLARIKEGVEARASTLRDAGIDVLNLHRRDWTADHVATVHAAGLRAFGWDAQSAAEIGGLLRLGLDGVYSDHVDLLMAAHRGPGDCRRLPRTGLRDVLASEGAETGEGPDPQERPADEQMFGNRADDPRVRRSRRGCHPS